jgi:hypothetical protein
LQVNSSVIGKSLSRANDPQAPGFYPPFARSESGKESAGMSGSARRNRKSSIGNPSARVNRAPVWFTGRGKVIKAQSERRD